MMDDIEFQLCLNIDSTDVKQDSATPRSKTRGRKRSAGSTGDGGDDGDGISGSRKIRGGHTRSDEERGRHLQLPPRKRIRTSSFSSIDRRGNVQVEDNTNDTAVRTVETVVSKRASLPDIGSVRDTDTPGGDSTGSNQDNDTSTVDMDVNMGIDDTVIHTANLPPEFQPRDVIHHRPQPPFAYFSEGAYMPALLDSLSSSRTVQAPRNHRFVIYEDADDMEVDDCGSVEQNLYYSPEDDKENADEEREHQDLQSQHSQERDYHHTYPGVGILHTSEPTVEQRDYHTTLTSFQDPITAGAAVGREAPLEGSSTLWSGSARRFASTDMGIGIGIGQDEVYQYPVSTPSPSSRADSTEHPLPSSTSLSATEVSLRALPDQSQTSEPDNPQTSLRLHPRRLRRAIRSI
ncbi:hypothetical protein BDW59DRAFT_140972, partial [Aspergillus cavernicola]